MFRSKLVLGFLIAALGLSVNVSATVAATVAADDPTAKLDNKTCLSCHDGNKGELEVPAADGETRPLLAVEPDGFAKSVHSDMQCIDCHEGITDSVANHKQTSAPKRPDCVQCHQKLQQSPNWEKRRREKAAAQGDCGKYRELQGVLPRASERG